MNNIQEVADRIVAKYLEDKILYRSDTGTLTSLDINSSETVELEDDKYYYHGSKSDNRYNQYVDTLDMIESKGGFYGI